MMHARFLAFTAPALLLGACGSAADPDGVLETVRATEQAQVEAITARDVRGATRNYRSDAVMVAPGGGPAAGADAIASLFAEMLADPNLALEVTPGPGWAAASGDLAVTTATARLTTTDPASGQAVTASLDNQTVWHKVDGAAWQIVSDHNVALPTAE